MSANPITAPTGRACPLLWQAPGVRIIHDAPAFVVQVRMSDRRYVDYDDYPTIDDALAEARELLSAEEFAQGKRVG